jgi:multicomponent Na+:H+ antiporter subunit D
MSGAVLALPVVTPLLGAALLVLLPERALLHRVVGLGVNAGVFVLGAFLLAQVMDGSVLAENFSGWTTPAIPIMFAADAFSALMVCVTALLTVVCLAFALTTGDASHRLFMPLVLVMSAGVYGAYLTADLFNLFVFIEVMLAPSYVLLVLAGGRKRVAAGRLYLTVSLFASTIFLAGIGLVYGVTGTVNLGQLAGAAGTSPAVAGAGALLLVAMAVKAALVPVHGWLPRAYIHGGPAVIALFSGLLTKVGVYAIFRLYAVLFDGNPDYRWMILVAALLSMVVGVLGAVGEKTMRAILTFHMISQIGYMIVGPALFTGAALAAGIFYILHHVLVKAALLITAGVVEVSYGTGRLSRLGGLVWREPLLAVAFMVAALSLTGIPPLSGFVAKLAIVRAAADEAQYVVVVVAVVVGLLTLISMIKIWTSVFWGHDGEVTWRDSPEGEPTKPHVRMSMVIPAVALAAFSIILGVGGQPLLEAAQVAAEGLIDTTAYQTAVTAP